MNRCKKVRYPFVKSYYFSDLPAMRPASSSSIAPRPYPREYWASTPSEQEALLVSARDARGPVRQLTAASDILKRARDRGATRMYSELNDALLAIEDAKIICEYNDSVVHVLRNTLVRRDAAPKRSYEATRDVPRRRKPRPPPSVRHQRRADAAAAAAPVDLDKPNDDDDEEDDDNNNAAAAAAPAASSPASGSDSDADVGDW